MIRIVTVRTNKTQQEACQLDQIGEELTKLDVQLSNDVTILRNQIEAASLELIEIQKLFDHAEREYIDAKLALLSRREHKDLLTAHLSNIIEQNELRKAKKLSDFIGEMQLNSVIVKKFMSPLKIINMNSTEEEKTSSTPREKQVST